jgi:hypothetical protein
MLTIARLFSLLLKALNEKTAPEEWPGSGEDHSAPQDDAILTAMRRRALKPPAWD